MPKVYTYAKCSTCRDAVRWLQDAGIDFRELPIRDTPPTKTELKRALKLQDGNIRRLFNTSGMDYRALGMKEKLPTMTEAAAIELLSKNGNLVKRPFVISETISLVGFKEPEWRKALLGK